MPRRRPTTVTVLLLVLAAGCGGGQTEPSVPTRVEAEVSAAPTEIGIGGSRLFLAVYVWRGQGTSGTPGAGEADPSCEQLCLNLTIQADGEEDIPDDLEVLDLVVVHGDGQSGFADWEAPGVTLGPSQYELRARGGPALSPGSIVDVAVQVDLGGRVTWLQASDVSVQAGPGADAGGV